MKKIIIQLCFISSIFQLKAQDYILKSQYDVDTFNSVYARMVWIHNDTTLPISKQITNIYNVAKKLKYNDANSISGPPEGYYSLEIKNTRIVKVDNFDSLFNNCKIGIENNPLLEEIGSFQNCKNLQGVSIKKNPKLKKIDMVLETNNFRWISIDSNAYLEKISIDLQKSKTNVSASNICYFESYQNSSLKSIELRSKYTAWTGLYIYYNDSLKSIYLDKANNYPNNQLFNYQPCDFLYDTRHQYSSLGLGLSINDNPQLEKIYGFEKDSFLLLYSELYNNTKLADLCFIKRPLENFRYKYCKPADVYKVYNNAPGASSLEEISKNNCVFYGVNINSPIISTSRFSPNPTSKWLEMKNEGEYSFSLYHMNGSKVYSLNGSDDFRLDISSLPRGIYIAELKNNNEYIKEKIVVE